jgi:predicted transcriptional regulator
MHYSSTSTPLAQHTVNNPRITDQILFLSIHPRFLDRILTGEKTVELRRQRPRDVTGQQVVLYATTPEKQLKGIARVTEIRSLPPQTLWPVVQHQAYVTQDEYQRYFEGSDQAVGIFLADAIAFEHPLSLESLRQAWPGFQPPQGFRYLTAEQRQLIGSLTVAKLGRKWAA